MNKYLKNPERLIEVRDCLINNPKRFRYTDWIEGNTEYITGKEMQCNDNWCGSCACVAGHAVCLACPPEMTIDDFLDGNTYGDKALQILGMSFEDNIYEFLFLPWEYDSDVCEELYGIKYFDFSDLYEEHEFALAEAISRINWILEEKPLEDYRISRILLSEFV